MLGKKLIGKLLALALFLAPSAGFALTQDIIGDKIDNSQQVNGLNEYLRRLAYMVEKSNPAGMVQAYAGSSVPAGWILCDGQAVSRTNFDRLFRAIGTVYGSGDGSTTFNVPDFRGRAPIGSGIGTGLSSFTIGTSTGAETISSAQLPSHTHTVGTYSSVFIEGRENSSGGTGSRVVWDNGAGDAINKSGALDPDGASHSHSLDSTSGTNNKFRTPELVVNFIIYTGF